jgi:hypothetical protein
MAAASQISLFTIQNGYVQIQKAFESFLVAKNYKGFQLITKKELISTYVRGMNIDERLKIICVPQSGRTVGTDYASASFRFMLQDPHADFLGIIDQSNNLVSFIIPHLGECRLLANMWSVNLICASGLAGAGQFLLPAMLYAAKIYYDRNGIQNPMVILELAQGHNNISGFISYTKAGFRRDPSLFYSETPQNCDNFSLRRCFCEKNTLPMSCHLDNFTLDDIYAMMVGQGLPQGDDLGIVNSSRSVLTFLGRPDLTEQQKNYIKDRQRQCLNMANEAYEAETKLEESVREGKTKSVITRQRNVVDRKKDSVKTCLGNIPNDPSKFPPYIASAPAVAAIASSSKAAPSKAAGVVPSKAAVAAVAAPFPSAPPLRRSSRVADRFSREFLLSPDELKQEERPVSRSVRRYGGDREHSPMRHHSPRHVERSPMRHHSSRHSAVAHRQPSPVRHRSPRLSPRHSPRHSAVAHRQPSPVRHRSPHRDNSPRRVIHSSSMMRKAW